MVYLLTVKMSIKNIFDKTMCFANIEKTMFAK